MTKQAVNSLSIRRVSSQAVARLIAVVALILISPKSYAQASLTAQPSTAEKLEFDVASVRQNKSGKPQSNIPLGPGNVYKPSGGLLIARNFPLLTFMEFAYKMTDYQEASLQATVPDWVISDRFTIEARTENHNVTKDQLRLMMRSLLAERFKLAVHYQARQVSVYALVAAKPGVLGPKIRAHPADSPCETDISSKTTPQTAKGDFPSVCGGILGLPASAQDRYSFGAANVPMSLIASALSSWGNLGRPVIDQTGLGGNYDFVLDYTPDPPASYAKEDSGGPTFQGALQKQLGLKLESQKGPADFLVLDHVEHPTKD